ncbi:hypothetical protein [Pseudomonas phage PA1C]|uniref:Uncharacterized protein n=1 Tax=Pseudomonas phage vB_PaeM_PS119XW TaxID=2601632 RepID=A0A5C1K6T1_9CAUD|nr:hypothetical protein PP933_gp119 [Pseudomonas phage vB_PaeM_PS119XW]QBX32274.1 hypothetical protein [Pseudomonas phage PA1C]QEM41848.1 hypothetical protein [Pseudomonas phage vB_PaeM_PS119XW]BEG72754.1 hypothetical protein RVBP21_3820 [Pseudomonas phage BRkr]
MKAIVMVLVGMVLGAAVVYGGSYEAPKVEKESEVILGHRIGPNGQEMLVTK